MDRDYDDYGEYFTPARAAGGDGFVSVAPNCLEPPTTQVRDMTGTYHRSIETLSANEPARVQAFTLKFFPGADSVTKAYKHVRDAMGLTSSNTEEHDKLCKELKAIGERAVALAKEMVGWVGGIGGGINTALTLILGICVVVLLIKVT